MATVDLTLTRSAHVCYLTKPEVMTYHVKVADIATAKGSAAAAADVVQIMDVKKGDIILSARCVSIHAGTATATFGHDGDVDGLIVGIDTSATANTVTGSIGALLQGLAAVPYSTIGGHFITADNTLDIVLGGTVDQTEEFMIIVEMIPLNNLF